MTASEDVYVEGEVEGKLDLGDSKLVVGQRGKVRAQVKAHSILVLGYLEGKVHAIDKTEIRKTGSLLGSLVTSRIISEDGAGFRGSIDISEPAKNEASATGSEAAEDKVRRPPPRSAPVPGKRPARSDPTTSRSKRRQKKPCFVISCLVIRDPKTKQAVRPLLQGSLRQKPCLVSRDSCFVKTSEACAGLRRAPGLKPCFVSRVP